jgi:hypothetical protein
VTQQKEIHTGRGTWGREREREREREKEREITIDGWMQIEYDLLTDTD